LFRARLTSLVANWMRVGYCQGHFNRRQTGAAGGSPLTIGPFGFCELFEPRFPSPDRRRRGMFSFFNQRVAAKANYQMFLGLHPTAARWQHEALRAWNQIHEWLR